MGDARALGDNIAVHANACWRLRARLDKLEVEAPRARNILEGTDQGSLEAVVADPEACAVVRSDRHQEESVYLGGIVDQQCIPCELVKLACGEAVLARCVLAKEAVQIDPISLARLIEQSEALRAQCALPGLR